MGWDGVERLGRAARCPEGSLWPLLVLNGEPAGGGQRTRPGFEARFSPFPSSVTSGNLGTSVSSFAEWE